MATIYRRGKAWYINWTEAGIRKQKSLGKIAEAEAEVQLKALEKRLSEPSAAGPLFRDWVVRYAQWHAQEYPDSYYRVEQILRTHLVPFFGALPLLEIRREQAEKYKHARLASGASVGTVTKEMRTLHACLNHAEAWDVIPRNPIHGVKAPRDLVSKPPRWYSKEELALIYGVELTVPKCTTAEDAELHGRYRWTWQLLANTGMRRSEAINLTWKDVGTEQIRILSDLDSRTKSAKWRSIPVSEGAGEALEALRGERWVLPRVRPESMSRAFDRTLKRAKLDGSMHCLRHTYCSHLVQAGVPLRTVQVLAGHASYRTTERYAHLAPGTLQDAIRVLRL